MAGVDELREQDRDVLETKPHEPRGPLLFR